ncbi:MAG TPA: sugar transferase [Thermomicrobiaceae bacterium]|nr:sugar transferase [Thermomicrobiaceae bacterium]
MLRQREAGFHDRAVETCAPDDANYFAVKRLFDVVVAGALLVACAPALLLIALLIKLDSRGPVIFRQERVGTRRLAGDPAQWETRVFRIFKFRSMVQNADQRVHEEHIRAFVAGEIAAQTDEDAAFKLHHDPRVTRVGRVLRKTSLDELPQLINVLRGEMSLVGPRPVPLYEVADYQPRHLERLAALPGITGLWQVDGRSRVTFEEMVEMDIRYVRSRSLLLDLRILLKTLPAVVAGRGAD